MLGHASAAMTLAVYSDLLVNEIDTVAVAMKQAKISSDVVKPLSAGDARARNDTRCLTGTAVYVTDESGDGGI